MNALGPLEQRFRGHTPTSQTLAARASTVFPGGATHRGRQTRPYEIFAVRAEGARKWDADGNGYIDYVNGHGALLLGHNHPEVVAAAQAAIATAAHFGANHTAELQWGEAVLKLMPKLERICFTASGNEAGALAVMLARAHTGRASVVRFAGHYHGWSVALESEPAVITLPAGDLEAVAQVLAAQPVAAILLEPTGASFGRQPLDAEFLRGLRALADRHETLLILDEVITGFRCAPGGIQQLWDVAGDLVMLGKILGGGYPCGAVAGRADVMALLDENQPGPKIAHLGTHNGHPLSAAAGLATLAVLADGSPNAIADQRAESLRGGLNTLFSRLDLPWAAAGTHSGFHLMAVDSSENNLPGAEIPVAALRLALALHGVHINPWPGGLLSAAHTAQDIAQTIEAFAAAIGLLRSEKIIG